MIQVSLLLLDGQEQLELWRKFLLAVESIGEVYYAYYAVGVDGNPQGLYIIASVCPAGEVRQVELYLVPTLVQTHGHGADKRFNAGG
jgi:hypothetical protein